MKTRLIRTSLIFLAGCFVGEEILDRYQKHQREKEEKKWHDSVQLYKGTTNCIDGMLRIIEATPIEYNESSTQYFDLEATIVNQYKIFFLEFDDKGYGLQVEEVKEDEMLSCQGYRGTRMIIDETRKVVAVDEGYVCKGEGHGSGFYPVLSFQPTREGLNISWDSQLRIGGEYSHLILPEQYQKATDLLTGFIRDNNDTALE